MAVPTTVIHFEDAEPGQPAYVSRVLVQGQKLRLDYGQDGDDFVLYDASAGRIYLVSMEERVVTEIVARQANPPPKKGWAVRVNREASGAERIVRVHLNDRQCAEYRSAPLLRGEMEMLRAFRQALSANQLVAWQRTPDGLRDPCHWLLDIKEAGIEYQSGLPMAIHYADGRSRRYKSHRVTDIPSGLFVLPAGFRRIALKAGQ